MVAGQKAGCRVTRLAPRFSLIRHQKARACLRHSAGARPESVLHSCWPVAATRRHKKKDLIMRTKLSIALTLFILIGAAPLLGACNTAAGAGEDISATGHAITHSAEKNTP
jgi:predicted small secreted protein